MRRTKAEAKETREQIFQAGIKVFAEKGYAATTMSDVAREAGCTRGAIYWHFKNKEAFFLETTNRLEHFYNKLVDTAILTEGDAVSVITSAIRSILRRFVSDPDFRAMQELVARTVLGHRDMSDTFERPIDKNENMAITLLQQAIQRGQIYENWSAKVALHAIASFVGGIFMTLIDNDESLTDSEIDDLVAFLGRGFAPTRTSATKSTTDQRHRALQSAQGGRK